MPPKKKAAGKAPAKAVAKAAEGTEGFPIIKYAEGDLVRSLDMVKLYPAKVLKVGSDDQYFIHYQGWNKKWDKWVHASLLMKEGPEADKYAKDLEEQEKKRKAAREAEKRGADSVDGEARKKPRVDYKRAIEPTDSSVPQLKIPLPFTLKKQLVDDWERITQIDPNMLVTLPRSPNVHDIIAEYLESKAKRTTQASQEKLSELFEGLRIYFDAALPVMLLYRQERAQYDELLKQDPEMMPSKVYGVEHLLRLFTKLPSVLGQASMSSVEAAQLQTNLQEFLKHLQRNAGSMFGGGAYSTAVPLAAVAATTATTAAAAAAATSSST